MLNLIYFLIASVTLTLLPGPDFILVVTLAATKGAKSAMSFAFGLCSGLVFHIIGATLGLGLILQASPSLYQGVRYLGFCYLLYLGVRCIYAYFKNSASETQNTSMTPKDFQQLYKQGIFMNILNPKVTLFFLSFFPQFIRAEGSLWEGPIGLGLIFIAQALVVFMLVSLLASKLKGIFKTRSKVALLVEGVLYFGIVIFLNI